MEEKTTIKILKARKFPGSDGINNELLGKVCSQIQLNH